MADGICYWAIDDDWGVDYDSDTDDGGMWGSTCQNLFRFSVGGPKLNEFKYCPFCGNDIVEVEKEPTPKDKDGDKT